MPAIHTEDFLSTSAPHRVLLPAPEYLTVPEVRQAAETYGRLHEEAWAHHQRQVAAAERAVLDARGEDERALADALIDGTKEPKPRTATIRAEAALADVKARQDAYWRALHMAHARLVETVTAHAEAWAVNVTAERADAEARYERAAAELAAAHRDLVATGGLLAMLREAPAGLSVRPYAPGALLGIAAAAVSDARAAVVAHERATAPVAAPVEAEEFAVA